MFAIIAMDGWMNFRTKKKEPISSIVDFQYFDCEYAKVR